MRRRTFIAHLGAVSVAWPLAARAQQNKNPVRLGFVPVGSPANPYDLSLVEAFRQGLRKVGLIENQNVVVDVAWVKADADQAVREVLQRGADVLIPCGSSASVAAQRQTATIPHCVPKRWRPLEPHVTLFDRSARSALTSCSNERSMSAFGTKRLFPRLPL